MAGSERDEVMDMSLERFAESIGEPLPQEVYEANPEDYFQSDSEVVSAPQSALKAIVHACALDMLYFGRKFFPKTMRMASPDFHRDVEEALCGDDRHVAIKMFRGAAKTSLLRVFTARALAFATHRTILFVSKSQDHSVKSVKWVKNAIDYNSQFATTFGLQPALDIRTGRPKKWTDEFITVYSSKYNCEISLVAVGILGQTRGLNIDDFRPDLIIVDDPCDEENTKTHESRKKLSDVFFGALDKSLAPRSENALAKLVLLQTPLDENDLVETAMRDPSFRSLAIGCFNSEGESNWPERWTTEELRQDKESHIARQQLTLWLREMEVVVVNDESSAFRSHWLRYWEEMPVGGFTLLSLDPTPPPKDWTKHPTKKHDDAVLQAWRFKFDAHGNPQCNLLEEFAVKSPLPDELVFRVFEWVLKYRPMELVMDTMMGQRTLKSNIEKEMITRRLYFMVHPYEDKREKGARIVGELNGPAAQGSIVIHKSHTGFATQFSKYPFVEHDDHLDAASMAVERGLKLLRYGLTIDGQATEIDQEDIDFPETSP